MSRIVGTGRHLSAVELRAWTAFLDAGRMLDDVLSRHVVMDHALTHREYEVLVRLDGNGGRLRMSALAQQIVASPALITQTIVRLEDRGLVERQAARSGDGRGVEAVILPAGRNALGAAAGDHAAIIEELLILRIGQDRVDMFADAMFDVASHLRAHRRGEHCDDVECPARRWG